MRGKRSRERRRRIISSCIDMAAISFSTTVPLIPLSLYHFQTFSIGGIFLNPLVIPVAEIAILCGFCSLCCGLFGLFACCQLFNFFARPFLWAIVFLTSSTGVMPWVQSGELPVCTPVLIPWASAVFFALHCTRSGGTAWKFIAPVAIAVLPLPLLRLFG
jgi:hypothetical protein